MERQDGRSPWTLTMDTHRCREEQGGCELLKRKNQEAGDASDGPVNCTVQICAAHTPQTFLETRLLQGDEPGFGPDQVCMCCSFGVVLQLGPTNAACPTSANPLPICEIPKVNIEDCSLLPSYWLQEP